MDVLGLKEQKCQKGELEELEALGNTYPQVLGFRTVPSRGAVLLLPWDWQQ